MISIRSRDHAWALCMGEIIRSHRQDSLFEYGTILHVHERVVDDSPMTSFLIFASSLLSESQQRITLADRTIHVSQLYPIHAQEAETIRRMGVETFFWDLEIDFYDTQRPPVVSP
jgi:hypothetical protein